MTKPPDHIREMIERGGSAPIVLRIADDDPGDPNIQLAEFRYRRADGRSGMVVMVRMPQNDHDKKPAESPPRAE